MARFTKLAVLLLSYVGSSMAQFEYLPEPDQVFAKSSDGGRIGQDNMVAIAPDDMKIFVTYDTGGCYVVSTNNGEVLYKIEAPEGDFSSNSGVHFAPVGGDSDDYYALYSIHNEAAGTSHVRKVGSDGVLAWTTEGFTGLAGGTPVATEDGKYVMFTYGQTFVVLRSSDGTVFYTEDPNPDGPGNAPGPFSPIGYFHSPAEGWYSVKGGGGDAGADNKQDVFLWGHKHDPSADGGVTGAMYVFQFPKFWNGLENDIDDFGVTYINNRGWTSETAPTIVDEGRSAYFSSNRNSFRAWVAEDADDNGSKWHNGATFATPLDEWGRGSPAYISPYTQPVVAAGVMVSGLAGSPGAIVLDAMTGDEVKVLGSSALPLRARPLVAHLEDRFYYIDVEGKFYCINPAGDIIYEESSFLTILGNPSLSNDGQVVYFGDTGGNILAWKVAKDDTPAPTISMSPTNSPTDMPSFSPSSSPAPSDPGTPSPTVSSAPTVTASVSPTESPTLSSAPTETASAAPTVTASSSPTVTASAAPTASPTASPTVDETPEPTPVPPTPNPTPSPTETAEPPTEPPTSGAAAKPFAAILSLCAAVGVAFFL